MKSFEQKLAHAVDPKNGDLLGAIGLVVDSKGNTLYHHADGRQSLAPDAPPLDPDSTVTLGSAGKFVTHLAALQLVDRGLLSLDEPLSGQIPEIDACQLLVRDVHGEFVLRPPAKPITLRHLLTHTSGITNMDKVKEICSDPAKTTIATAEDAHILVRMFTQPLLFEPDEGFYYGNSIHWTQLAVQRAAGTRFLSYVQEHILDVIGMPLSTYLPLENKDVWDRRLHMVERGEDGHSLVETSDDEVVNQGLTCSMTDLGRILSDLISPTSKLLSSPAMRETFFRGGLAPGSIALKSFRSDPENYGFCTNKPATAPAVNWAAAGGMTAEETLPASDIPAGSVVWEGMPNVMWSMNPEKGVASFFATQVIPAGDPKANELALAFQRDVWKTFG